MHGLLLSLRSRLQQVRGSGKIAMKDSQREKTVIKYNLCNSYTDVLLNITGSDLLSCIVLVTVTSSSFSCFCFGRFFLRDILLFTE